MKGASGLARLMRPRVLCRRFFALLACIVAAPHIAWAGTISISFSLTGTTLTVKSIGDSSAFFLQVLRLLPDGHWEKLHESPGSIPPVEFVPEAYFNFNWAPIPKNPGNLSPFEDMQPLMVRFFDQAGVGFGQISFLHPPSQASSTLNAYYDKGELVVYPPKENDSRTKIRSSWLLWPQEEGIAPLRLPLRQGTVQPPARHIEWSKSTTPLHFHTGSGQPSAILLHDTEHGYGAQFVPAGRLVGKEQSPSWLNVHRNFYYFALMALLTACGTLLVWVAMSLKKKDLADDK